MSEDEDINTKGFELRIVYIINPISKTVGNLQELNWKSVYKGFKEFEIPMKDKDQIKLIKMDPGTSVPLHSHNGREYILVLDGSFSDENGEYIKGDLQINDHNTALLHLLYAEH